MKDILQQLEQRRDVARQGGGSKRIEAQHAKGKLTARERVSCCWMKTVSKSLTCLLRIAALILVWKNSARPAMV